MKDCIVKEGEKWAECKYHLNEKGEHGQYRCIYFQKKNYFSWFGHCTREKNFLKDEDFKI